MEALLDILSKQKETAYLEFLKSLKAADRWVLIHDGKRAFCDEQACAEGDDRGVLFWPAGDGAHVNIRGSKKMLADFSGWTDKTYASPLHMMPCRRRRGDRVT